MKKKNRHLLFSFFWFPEFQRWGCQLGKHTVEQKNLYQQSRLKYPSPFHIMVIVRHRRGAREDGEGVGEGMFGRGNGKKKKGKGRLEEKS